MEKPDFPAHMASHEIGRPIYMLKLLGIAMITPLILVWRRVLDGWLKPKRTAEARVASFMLCCPCCLMENICNNEELHEHGNSAFYHANKDACSINKQMDI